MAKKPKADKEVLDKVMEPTEVKETKPKKTRVVREDPPVEPPVEPIVETPVYMDLSLIHI